MKQSLQMKTADWTTQISHQLAGKYFFKFNLFEIKNSKTACSNHLYSIRFDRYQPIRTSHSMHPHLHASRFTLFMRVLKIFATVYNDLSPHLSPTTLLSSLHPLSLRNNPPHATPPRQIPSLRNMALLRNIGNVFRRDDRTDQTTDHTFTPSIITTSFSSKIMGVGDVPIEDSPDLYYEDRPLGASIHTLEQIRLSLRELAAAANEHKDMLAATANTEKALGDVLADVLHPQFVHPDSDDDPYTDITVDDPPQDENAGNNHFSSYLPIEAREAQKALGRGLACHSDATVKLSVAISAPINDLTRSFEDRYSRKIIPLRRRYIDQKGQYLKYKRNADMAETDEKKSYYEALAEAAKPVWMRTSTELRTESDVMTELTAKNMAKWSKSLALQHERALAIAAANFADAFNRAKTLPSLSRAAGQ